MSETLRLEPDTIIVRRPNFFVELARMLLKIFLGGLLILLFIGAGSAMLEGDVEPSERYAVLDGDEEATNALMRVDVVGPIMSHADDDDGFFGISEDVTYGYEVYETLVDASEDDDVKGVLMYVQTPGGTIVGSQAIFDGVKAVQDAGKPVVVYVDGFSASGGVWSTAGADAIFADVGSVIGSIGVISGGFFEYIDPKSFGGIFGGVETDGGIKLHLTTAGIGKDLGNPFRAPTEVELARMQDMADEFYMKFVDHMVEHRGMDRDRIVNEFGASIFANDAAEANGYIDGTKSYPASIAFLAEEAGLGEDFKLVEPTSDGMGDFPFSFIQTRRSPSQHHTQVDPALGRAKLCGALTSQAVAMPQLYIAKYCG